MVLEANVPRLEARDRLEQAVSGKLKLAPKAWYDLMLDAGYDLDEAEAAHNAAVKAALKRGEQVGETV